MSEQRSVGAVYRTGLMGLGLLAGMVVGGAGAAQAAEPDRGNSARAHACQHEGWRQLVREGGAPFANQGECVEYAPGGGVLTPRDVKPPLHRAYVEACTGDGGLFYEDVNGTPVLGCSFVVVEVGDQHPEATAAMQEICEAAGGAFIHRHEGQAVHVVCTLPT